MNESHGKNKHATPNRMKVNHKTSNITINRITNNTTGENMLMSFRLKFIYREKRITYKWIKFKKRSSNT